MNLTETMNQQALVKIEPKTEADLKMLVYAGNLTSYRHRMNCKFANPTCTIGAVVEGIVAILFFASIPTILALIWR